VTKIQLKLARIIIGGYLGSFGLIPRHLVFWKIRNKDVLLSNWRPESGWEKIMIKIQLKSARIIIEGYLGRFGLIPEHLISFRKFATRMFLRTPIGQNYRPIFISPIQGNSFLMRLIKIPTKQHYSSTMFGEISVYAYTFPCKHFWMPANIAK
jgi:hypothetical protein